MTAGIRSASLALCLAAGACSSSPTVPPGPPALRGERAADLPPAIANAVRRDAPGARVYSFTETVDAAGDTRYVVYLQTRDAVNQKMHYANDGTRRFGL